VLPSTPEQLLAGNPTIVLAKPLRHAHVSSTALFSVGLSYLAYPTSSLIGAAPTPATRSGHRSLSAIWRLKSWHAGCSAPQELAPPPRGVPA
jgi:hypothetical protein